MTRTEREKFIKRRRRFVMVIGVVVLLSIFGIGRKFLNFGKSESYIVKAQGTEKTYNYDTPVIKVLKTEIDKYIAEEQQKAYDQMKKEQLAKENAGKNVKIAYLTFDDGPSKHVTPRILDILKENDIKATFFVQGQNVKLYPELIKRINDEGHAIGHHSYTHNYKYLYANYDNFMSDIYKTEKELQNVLGPEYKTHLLRLPGGGFGSKKKFVDHAASKGYINYNWNALNGDAEGNGFSKQRLLSRLKETVGKQKNVIILQHDTDAKKSTAEYLPEAISYLKSEGFEFRILE